MVHPTGIGPVSSAFQTAAITISAKDANFGGDGEIRTHGAISDPLVFKTSAINRSATSPNTSRSAD